MTELRVIVMVTECKLGKVINYMHDSSENNELKHNDKHSKYKFLLLLHIYICLCKKTHIKKVATGQLGASTGSGERNLKLHSRAASRWQMTLYLYGMIYWGSLATQADWRRPTTKNSFSCLSWWHSPPRGHKVLKNFEYEETGHVQDDINHRVVVVRG